MKKTFTRAFTLSEALITLAILGVLASILIPLINNVRPDKDKLTYKKALYDMQAAVSNALESSVYSNAANSAAYWGDESVQEDDFCKAIADSLNVIKDKGSNQDVNCNPEGKSSYDNPNFVTTDGIRYWGLEGKKFDVTNSDKSKRVKERDICVDRKLSAKEIEKIVSMRGRQNNGEDICKGGLKIRVRYDGKVITPEKVTDNSGNEMKINYNYENDLIKDALSVSREK